MSTKRRIYLDFNATSPLAPAVCEAMTAAMAELGNPSSLHAEGRRARDRIENARRQVAVAAGRPREHVVFTSGGTEANALGVLALASAAEARGLPRVAATSPIEHPSLVGAIDVLRRRGWTVQVLPIDDRGSIGIGTEPIGLLAVAVVNHELGTRLSDDVIAWSRSHGGLVHLDAVQAAGKIDLAKLDGDAFAISAHKLGGPQGVGAVVIAVDSGLPIIANGHQERGRRGGTENTLGIIGFGAAARTIDVATWGIVDALGLRLEAGLERLPGVRIHAQNAPRFTSTINAGFAGALGESIAIALDLAGIAVSTGAACTSGSVEPSPVLLGLGMTPVQAREAVRFSLGRTTTAGEIDEVLATLPSIVDRVRKHH